MIDSRTTRRPDCVTEIRMGNSVLVVSGYFKKDTTTTAADKMARRNGHTGERGRLLYLLEIKHRTILVAFWYW